MTRERVTRGRLRTQLCTGYSMTKQSQMNERVTRGRTLARGAGAMFGDETRASRRRRRRRAQRGHGPGRVGGVVHRVGVMLASWNSVDSCLERHTVSIS